MRQKYILWLYIHVNEIMAVQMFQSHQNVLIEELAFIGQVVNLQLKYPKSVPQEVRHTCC